MISGSKPDFCNSLFSVGLAKPSIHAESRRDGTHAPRTSKFLPVECKNWERLPYIFNFNLHLAKPGSANRMSNNNEIRRHFIREII